MGKKRRLKTLYIEFCALFIFILLIYASGKVFLLGNYVFAIILDSVSASIDVGKDTEFKDADAECTEEINYDDTVYESVEILLKRLDNQKNCLVQKSNGWWNYIWCHNQFVAQFPSDVAARHLSTLTEKMKEKDSDMIILGAEISAMYLSKYFFTLVFLSDIYEDEGFERLRIFGKDGYIDKTNILYVLKNRIEYDFVNGDICLDDKQENHRARQVRVKLYCCLVESEMKEIISLDYFAIEKKASYIISIEEPEICRYEIKVCAKEICHLSRITENVESLYALKIENNLTEDNLKSLLGAEAAGRKNISPAHSSSLNSLSSKEITGTSIFS